MALIQYGLRRVKLIDLTKYKQRENNEFFVQR